MSLESCRKTKIVLIHLPVEEVFRKYYIHDITQPLGLGYIAAVLEQAGYEVGIIDAKVEQLSIPEILERISEFKPSIVGLSVFTPDFCIARRLAEQIKNSGDYTIIIGGKHVSALPEETLQEGCFDYGIVGEGERTVVELCRALSQNDTASIPAIRGIVFRQDSRIIRTPPQPYIEDLDTLPFPARHLFPPLSKYTYLYYKSLPVAVIVTSRGCPYQCTFCDRAVFGNKLRLRSIENVLDEIEMLVKDYGVRNIDILDDLFTINPERVAEFCKGLLSRGLKVSWSCASRVDTITPDMLKLMKQSGCWMICYGIESGNQKILDTIKKNITLESVERAVRMANDADMRVIGFFIFGLPDENEETLRNTIAFAKKLSLDEAHFSIFKALPGSEIYQMALTRGQLKKDIDYRYYYLFSARWLSYVADGLTADMLKRYRKKAYRDFYLRPAFIFRQLTKYHEFQALPARIKALLKAVL